METHTRAEPDSKRLTNYEITSRKETVPHAMERAGTTMAQRIVRGGNPPTFGKALRMYHKLDNKAI